MVVELYQYDYIVDYASEYRVAILSCNEYVLCNQHRQHVCLKQAECAHQRKSQLE